MAPDEESVQDDTPFHEIDDEYGTSRETFEVSDPGHVGLQRRRWNIWIRWMRFPFQSRRNGRRIVHDEADGLLHGLHDSVAEAVPRIGKKRQSSWCIYGVNSTLSILMFLILMNLLFGFATILQMPGRPDPFEGWDKPGTTSEGLAWYPTDFLRDVIPIPCHSHNDYWRKVPLFSALYNGCISVEADVWAFDGELYVGHNTASLTANRTFQSLYISPLVAILGRQNPTTLFYNGSSHGVFDTDADQSLTLLVDVKTEGTETWPMVLRQLEPLRTKGWLTYVENNIVHRGPITVVGTGETPFDILTSNLTYRDAFFDAPLSQMWEDSSPDEGDPIQPGINNIEDAGNSNSHTVNSRSITTLHNGILSPITARSQRRGQANARASPTDSYTPTNSYYASTSFNEMIGTIWWGRLNSDQLELIRGHIRGAHLRGLKARYWDTPSWPTSMRNYVWNVLFQEGVDVLNVDDLEAVRSSIW